MHEGFRRCPPGLSNTALCPTFHNTNVLPEFYNHLAEDTIVAARRELMHFLQKYNSYRPYTSLRGLTPLGYISKYSSGDSSCLASGWTWTRGILLKTQLGYHRKRQTRTPQNYNPPRSLHGLITLGYIPKDSSGDSSCLASVWTWTRGILRKSRLGYHRRR